MNKTFLNVVSLAKDPIIQKGEGGGGSGVTINNQEKSLEITENGVTEVTADSGFTGLSKVIVNTNVQSGGGAPVSKPVNDVNFYDYDGTILHSYTKDEFLAMSAMPPLPEREGLICQEWNWDLDEAQDFVADIGTIEIGAIYATDDEKTRIYIYLPNDSKLDMPIRLYHYPSSTATIDWGDGSEPEDVASGGQTLRHEYKSKGYYCISIYVADGGTITLGGKYSYEQDTIAANEAYYEACVLGIECGKRCVIGGYAMKGFNSLAFMMLDVDMTTSSFTEYALIQTYSLRHVTIPRGVTSTPNYMMYTCYGLQSVSAPKTFYAGKYAFYNCLSLRRITQSSTGFGEHAFTSTKLSSYKIRGSSAYFSQQNSFSSCNAMAFFDLTNVSAVPSLKNTNVFGYVDANFKIIVPDALYDEWIATTNWSGLASYIIKKSDWDASQS